MIEVTQRCDACGGRRPIDSPCQDCGPAASLLRRTAARVATVIVAVGAALTQLV